MAIKNLENGNVQVEFGKGDVLTGIHFCKGSSKARALVMLNASVPGPVGQYIFAKDTEDWDVEDHPVQLVFNSPESVELIINQLIRLKTGMQLDMEGK